MQATAASDEAIADLAADLVVLVDQIALECREQHTISGVSADRLRELRVRAEQILSSDD